LFRRQFWLSHRQPDKLSVLNVGDQFGQPDVVLLDVTRELDFFDEYSLGAPHHFELVFAIFVAKRVHHVLAFSEIAQRQHLGVGAVVAGNGQRNLV
jgi:hypothetical protein